MVAGLLAAGRFEDEGASRVMSVAFLSIIIAVGTRSYKYFKHARVVFQQLQTKMRERLFESVAWASCVIWSTRDNPRELVLGDLHQARQTGGQVGR